MMCKSERAKTILNNMLELYNYEMGCDYTFKEVKEVCDDLYVTYFGASINENPFLFFAVCMTEFYFSVEIFERTGNNKDDYNHIFLYKNV